MRESIKSIGLILAIVVAGISLSASIISFMNKSPTPTTEINNYYYYEENYYGNNETENFILPLQVWKFIDVENDDIFLTVNYTLDCKNWLYISGNETLGDQQVQINIYFVDWVNMGNYRLEAQFELNSVSYITS